MDTTKFLETKTGTLIPIKITAGTDYAFIPNPLPKLWEFPQHLWPRLVEARAVLAKLDGIGRTLPHPELLLSPLRRREAITSSRIEGTYATAQELMLFEMNPSEPKSKHDEVNSWKEVANYSNSLAKGTRLLQELPFCSRMIKDLHEVLMSGVRGQQSRPGEFRDHQVAIGSERRYVPPPPAEMIQCINDLEVFINKHINNFDPLVLAFMVHYQIEAIHPFSDGNGRIGRVMLSLMVGEWCELTFPWLYMSPYFEKHKDEYVENMFKVSSEGAWDKWIGFCLNGTILQAKDAINRCERLCDLKDNMLKRVRPAKSPRIEQIIHELFSIPIVKVSALHKKLNVTYPTAQADVDILVKSGVLSLLKEARPKSYFSQEIISIAYDDAPAI